MIIAKSMNVHYARLFLLKTLFLNPHGPGNAQKRGCRNMDDMNTGKKTNLRSAAILLVLGYAVIWSIGCSPMAVLAHETLGCAGIDSRIALADVAGVESYGHYYILIYGEPCEPRYIGLHLQGNIDYNNPLRQYNSTEEFLNDGNDLLPSVALILDAACERAGSVFENNCR